MLDKLVLIAIIIAAVYYLYRRFKRMISTDSSSCGCGGGCGCSTLPNAVPGPTESSKNKKE
ncbi:MAG: FeoB-associated Cys-rich membrane protein [Desulfobacterales bacterium]|nr:FeoB-associated Cys-rich membrane protein [Desulfobacterales bacterium]